MANRVHVGMLASLALHVLPLGAWWVQAPYSPNDPAASQAENVIAVSLLTGSNRDGVTRQESSPASLPEPATAITVEREQTVRLEATSQSILPVLPLKEPPYIPAGELNERPFSEAPIIIPFPDIPLDTPRAAGVLVLYIGANGYVDRIEVDESNLPPEFEKAAIDTFLQARMRPGMKDGQPTRARMKILVEFEQK